LLTALFDLQMPPRWVYDHSEKSHNDQSKVRFYDTGDLIDAECIVNIVDG